MCKTKNFTDVILDQTTLNSWLGYAKKLAEPKNFKDLENRYVDYTKKVSQLAAVEDMKVVYSAINKYNSEINTNKKQIQELNNQIKGREDQWEEENNSYLHRIKVEKEYISNYKSKRSEKVMGLTIGGVMLVFGVILLFYGGWGILWGLIIGFIGLLILTDSAGKDSFQTLDEMESDAKTNIQAEKELKAKEKNSLVKILLLIEKL